MSKITIIGTSGAGKTVFITVLAERYSKIKPGRAYMEYANAETKEYSAGVWGDLVDKQKWPDSTPAGKLLDLQWILRTPDGDAHEMNVLDTPGQDIQAIYMPKKDESGKPVDLTENQKMLKKSIEEADVLVLLVNLRNIADAKTIREKTEFEVPIVMAAKDAFGRAARVAVLFSQHDQLRALFAEKGLSSKDPITIVQEYIPGAVASIRSAGKNAYVGFVAAVANTETITEISNGELKTRSCPAKGFDSEGLEDVMAWLSGTLRGVEVEAHNNEINGEIKTLNIELKKDCDALKTAKKNFYSVLSSGIVLCLLSLLPGIGVSYLLSQPFLDDPRPEPKWQEPPKFEANREEAFSSAEVRTPPSESWSWWIRTNESLLGLVGDGRDDVYIQNNSKQTWEYIEATLMPNNSYGSYKLRRKQMIVPGGCAVWRYEHNFKYKGGRMELKVITRDDIENEIRKQKARYNEERMAEEQKYKIDHSKWKSEKSTLPQNLEKEVSFMLWGGAITFLLSLILFWKRLIVVWKPMMEAQKQKSGIISKISSLEKSKRR